ncbi:alpha-L-fucosidase [Streptosporangium subroseum]|nr:alpha-L-fucosidase [Streptosporangium subroseum]
MFQDAPQRPEQYRKFDRETPRWFSDAKLGIFVHWGPFSVPAWAEPIGASGTMDLAHFFKHNPYAEWYHNTIRVPGSPAAERHRDVHGGAPYDDFLDQWTAKNFDADEFMALVAATGAGYFVPTAKHHDGVTLWDAPGTGKRNTVHRGPRRDLIGEFSAAARAVGIRFGVYYSGGLDWHFGDSPPIVDESSFGARPIDRAYADYAFDHVSDLIARYRPDVLWGDIEWPDAGKPEGPKSLVRLFEAFYAATPDGVVNDRWGETHWDFRTSEYQHGRGIEGASMWENTRGTGYSFGYNQLEDEGHSLSGPEAIRHFVDVVSRGGNLLLNVGLMEDGTVPALQRRTLTELAMWNAANGSSVFGSVPVAGDIAKPGAEPWVRWTRTGEEVHAFISTTGSAVTLEVDPARIDAGSARFTGGERASAQVADLGVILTMPVNPAAGPVQVTFDLRSA